jgi:membrane protein implicated in regulation of membrane protease activity
MAWHAWVVVAVGLFIGEIFTPGFYLLPFGLGCLTSAVFSTVGWQLEAQIAGFIAGTLVTFFSVRPALIRWAYGSSEEVKTNVDALVNQNGRVTETIDSRTGSGRVAVGGDDWKAVSSEDEIIEKGAHIEVLKVSGVTLTVRPTDRRS